MQAYFRTKYSKLCLQRKIFFFENVRINLSVSLNIGDCYPRTCKNNATCFDGINNCTCACVSGFEGKNCSIGKLLNNFNKLFLVQKSTEMFSRFFTSQRKHFSVAVGSICTTSKICLSLVNSLLLLLLLLLLLPLLLSPFQTQMTVILTRV